jgi:metal-responsive CopG/Arc/MetJ family transcriptional regulator
LPDELRQELDNVEHEEMLTSRQELIRLYYLSLQKKSLSREE